MSHPPRVDAASATGWSDLVGELDRWADAGRIAALWWRDDDAVAATPALDPLLRLAAAVPLALAVIPALARSDLAARLSDAPRVAVLQHGWQHANRAEHGKKSEYPKGRSVAVVRAEVGAGRARLTALFGRRALPVFVPPWNRLAEEFLSLLPENGMKGLSTMARPSAPPLPAAMVALDVHVDLVAWRGDRGFIGAAAALAGVICRLRRQRADAAAGPIGILTHHRIMDAATARFLDRLIARTSVHPAIRWVAAGELLQ